MKDIPADLTAALVGAGLDTYFAECTAANRNEYLKWISEAKRPETRIARIEKAVVMIGAKRAEEAGRAARR